MQDAEGIITLPGARELLLQLPAKRWTIATSARGCWPKSDSAAGLPVPERIVTSTDVTRGKPHPEPFLKAAAKLGFTAGARVIAFRTTVEEAELRRAGADFILNNCIDVGVAHTSGGLTLILNGTQVEN